VSRPLIWLPLQVAYVDAGLMVTPNLGSASSTVLVGDGTTAARMPALVSPSVNLRHGMTCPTNLRYLRGTIPALGSDGTLVCQWIFPDTQAAASASIMQIGTGVIGAGEVLLYVVYGTKTLYGFWGGVAGPVTAAVFMAGLHTLMLSSAAGLASLYWDGRLVAGPGAIAAPVTATDWCAMGDPVVAYDTTAGIMAHASVWPFGFTGQQASIMHQRLTKDLSC